MQFGDALGARENPIRGGAVRNIEQGGRRQILLGRDATSTREWRGIGEFALLRVMNDIARVFTKRIAMPTLPIAPALLTILLLIGSNVFMTTAWYWHLRFREVPLWQVILASWGLAFVEYCLAVPANRYGSYVYSAAQLKTIQEVITLSVFAVFSVVYLQQPITWNQVIGFALIAGGAFFVFRAPI
jgi:uncharacterized protein (DUF486 family)